MRRETLTLSKRTLATVLTNSVMSLLSELSSHTNYDSPVQRWYQPFLFSIPDMGIWAVQITPLDDKIPLRNIFLPDGNTMRRELTEVWREMWNKLRHRELEQLTLDFIDKNNRPRVGSREEKYFINRAPYDISEFLILSNDITRETVYGDDGILGLSDYCTVYSDGKININVAPVHVMELLPGLDTGGLAQSIAEHRTENAIENFQDLQKLPGASARTSTQLTNIVSFKSRYFNIKLQSIIENEEDTSSFSVIFDRTAKKIVRWEEL